MKTQMRRFLLFVGVGSLVFSLACGGTGGGKSSGGGGGSFSNASLSGHYAYQLKGYSLPSQSPFREAGVFTADGNGHLNNVIDDFAAGGSVSTVNTTGSYQINGDGSGTLTINLSGGNAVFEITLSTSNQFYMVEIDSVFAKGFVASGMGQKQDTTAFGSAPNGTFVFRMHTLADPQNALDPTSVVGRLTLNAGVVTAANIDKQTFPSLDPSTLTGAFNTPDNNGRGAATLVDSSGTFVDSSATLTLQYYVLDANHLILFSTNSTGTIGIGVAERQTGPFTTASFSGPYAFGSSGDTQTFFEQTNTAGRFNADASGGINSGVFDSVTDGATSTNIAFTGSYTVASNGRVLVTLNANGGTIQQVYWMVNPSRAFTVTDSASTVEDGSLDLQVGSLSTATLNNFYAFNMDGFDNGLNNTKQRVGIIDFGGTGTLTLGEVSNANGAATSSNLNGTYSVASSGRVTASVNNLSNNLVLYLVSDSNAYMLQADTGVSIRGTMMKQP